MSFVCFLLPAFVVFVWHYLTCDRVAVYYGDLGDCYCDDDGGDCGSAENEVGSANDGKKRISKTSTGESKSCRKRRTPLLSRHYLDIYGSRTHFPRMNRTSPSPNSYSCKNSGCNNKGKKPVVIFLTGGAWIIGYRMWGTLLGRALAPFGILVIVPDYRNFPAVNISQMVDDVDKSIDWVFNNVEEYGGDKEKIVLVGQSAGAHIGGVVVARKVRDWIRMKSVGLGWDIQNCNHFSNELPPLASTYQPFDLKGFISTSAPHNLVTMREVFHRHGLSSSVQRSIFGGAESSARKHDNDGDDNHLFEKWSTYHLVQKCRLDYAEMEKLMQRRNCQPANGVTNGNGYTKISCRKIQHCDYFDSDDKFNPKLCNMLLKDIFPKLCVIHGTCDKTVPVKESIEFTSLLKEMDIPVVTKFYNGWSHTDPILEAPMRGNHLYHCDIFDLVCLWSDGMELCKHGAVCESVEPTLVAFDQSHPKLQSICPKVLVELARICNPF